MHSIYDFIITASHIECNISKLQNQFNLIEKNNNLNELFTASYLHGVFPLIYSKLKLLVIDEDILKIFKEQNINIVQMNMQRTNELLQVIKLLDENNITYMVIKGPVLSQQIHSDISKRQYSDLDILVDEVNAYEVGKILLKNNYYSNNSIKFLKNKILLKVGKDFQFIHKQSENILELHWQLFTNKEMNINNITFGLQDFQNVKVFNTNIKTLNIENLLIYLSLHGSKHYWERLAWVVDIDRLISQNNLEWDLIEKNVYKMKHEKMFYLGLLVSVTLFNTSLPKNILEKIKKFSSILPIANDIVDLLYENNIAIKAADEISLDNIVSVGKLKDTKLSIFRHYLVNFLQLKEGDIYVVNLPLYLSPLYYLIRLFRVFFKLQK